MQKITLIGRLGRDAAIRETQDGGKVISFTVAVNGRFRGVEKTSWYDVSTFNYDRYKNMLKYLTKGSGVIVVGELDADIDEGRDGVTRVRRSVVADSIEFNSNGVSGNTTNNQATAAPAAPAHAPAPAAAPADDAPVPSDEEVSVTTSRKGRPKKAEPVAEETAPAVPEGDDDDNDLPF